jgi:hypothetical protein
MDGVWTFVITGVVVTVAIVRSGGFAKLVATLAEEMNDHWRGGPPTTPMHPSPVNDIRLLLRRAPKAQSEHFRR